MGAHARARLVALGAGFKNGTGMPRRAPMMHAARRVQALGACIFSLVRSLSLSVWGRQVLCLLG